MKINVLFFTETMQSLLSSSLQLQDALMLCTEILPGKKERAFCNNVLKGVNEGCRLKDSLEKTGVEFSNLYLALVQIGEESGNLGTVFSRLSDYLKRLKESREKLLLAVMYPAVVFITAVMVVFLMLFFVMPRLEEIFVAFTESSGGVQFEAEKIRFHLIVFGFFLLVIFFLSVMFFVIHKTDGKLRNVQDSLVLKIPGIGNAVTALQMQDFTFAMKILTESHFPFVQCLKEAGEVLSNKCLKNAVSEVLRGVSSGEDAGDCFEKAKVFPSYFTMWVKIAEQNGNVSESFSRIYEFYSGRSQNIYSGITSLLEPAFIVITGIILILAISQFVIPVFNLLGAL